MNNGLYHFIFCFILCSVCWLTATGQDPTYIHYEVNDGLPGTEVYQSIQDDLGYLWFGTDQGLVRFNGVEFEVFTTQNGLVSNVIFGFSKGFNGKIWFYTYYGGIGFLQDGTIHIPDFNDSLKTIIDSDIICSLVEIEKNTIWIGLKNRSGHIKIDSVGNVHEYDFEKNKCNSYIFEFSDSALIYGRGNKKFGNNSNLTFFNNKDTFNFDLSNFTSNIRRHYQPIRTQNGLFLVVNNIILQIVGANIVQKRLLPGYATMSLFEDKNQNLWVGLEHMGALCFENGNLNAEPSAFLDKYSVSSINLDNQGGMWFTTLSSGIFYVRNLAIHSKKYGGYLQSEPIMSLCIYDESLWVGTRHGNIFKQNIAFDEDAKLQFRDLQEIQFIKNAKDKIFIGVLGAEKQAKNLHQEVQFIHPQNKIGILNSDSLFQLFRLRKKGEQNNTKFTLPALSKKILCNFDWNSKIFLGTSDGLYFLEDIDSEKWIPYKLPNTYWINKVVVRDALIYMGSREHGLLIHDGFHTIQIDQKAGILSNTIETIALQDKLNIWIGTKKGINHVELNEDHSIKNIRSITTSEGLISNEINKIIYHKDNIWAATNEGLSRFDANESFFNATPPAIYLKKLGVNGSFQDFDFENSFDYHSKVFHFQFEGIDFRSADKIQYQYRLKGFDNQWTKTNDNEVRYMLTSGAYTFEVKAQNSSDVLSTAAATFEFTISAPFWKQLWFIALVLFLISLGGFFLFQRRMMIIRKETDLEIKMAQFQHQALSAQLKPHFIFNAINSIHNFIRKNEKEKSSQYLILFSNLIRQILSNSKASMVNLVQELSLLEKYLKIEQLRFKERLTYSIELGKNMEIEQLKIPTQLIQPFVENAIWHGIMPKEEAGHIQIKMEKKGEELFCKIIDNGIGRAAAKKMREANHKSTGIELTQQRLKLIEAIYKRPVKISITDLKDKMGKPSGTKVNLIIPIFK